MKKMICLGMVLFLCLSILAGISLAAGSGIQIGSVVYDDGDRTVTVDGTATEEYRQLILQLWDVSNDRMISFISIGVSDGGFQAIMQTTGLPDGEYRIKVADYFGGEYVNESFAVPSGPASTPTPMLTPTSTPTPAPTSSSAPETSTGSPGGTSSAPSSTAQVTGNKIEMAEAVNPDGVVDTEVDKESIEQAFENAEEDESGVKHIEIEIKPSSEATGYNTQLPADVLSSGSADIHLDIITPIASIAIPGGIFETSALTGAESVAFSVSVADRAALPAEVAGAIGSRPIINISAAIDGEAMEWSNPGAPVTISIPYTPTADELADSEHITVWYVDGNGDPVPVPSGRYDPGTGTVTFTVTHFSTYAVAYVKKTFDDMNGYAWVARQVSVLASKGIIEGASDTAFAPQRNITRGEFILWLVKSLDLNAEADANFTDISASDKYYEALGIARKLGIALGKGDGKYYPEEQIIRQDMMILAARALKAAKRGLATGTPADLAGFRDAAKIAEYAKPGAATMVRAGIIVGNGGYINPTGTAARAEAAMVTYRLYAYMTTQG